MVPTETVRAVPEGEVVYGLELPIVSRATPHAAPWEKEAGPAELARLARVADESGFFSLVVGDHTAVPRRLADAMGTVWFDATATLGWLAAVTRNVHLLPHLYVLAQRHPLRAAKELSTVDVLSGGRLIVGVSEGPVPEEYELLAGGYGERGPRTDEAVSALARCFTEEFPSLPGPHWRVGDMGLGPLPARRPRPPIWVSGSTPEAIRRAAACGDGWLAGAARRGDLRDQVELLHQLRAELGAGAPIDVGVALGPLHLRDGSPGPALPSAVLVGGPQEIAESLRELAAAGANHLQLRFAARDVEECCAQVARFGVEVAPLLGR